MSEDVFHAAAFAPHEWGLGGFDGVGFYTGGAQGSGPASLTGVASRFGDPVELDLGGLRLRLAAYGAVPGGILLATPDFATFYVFRSGGFDPSCRYPITYGFGAFRPPCFVAGTRIASDRGEVPVEALRVGDRVVALRTGGFAPVAWIGHRQVGLEPRRRGEDVWPVRIAADAFAPGQPARDLCLSPDHAVFADGALIPARDLVNGATITQDETRSVSYWHVELPSHDVLLADGLPCESYLDTGNRALFAPRPPAALAGQHGAARPWRERLCAPLLLEPTQHAPLRRRLLARATALGFALTDDPALRLLADGTTLPARRTGWSWQARVPAGVRALRLLSRSVVPARLHPDSADHRRLGVAVIDLRLGGEPIPPQPRGPEDPEPGEGWHEPEPGLRWTDGEAVLRWPATTGDRLLELRIAPLPRYWLPAGSPGRIALAA